MKQKFLNWAKRLSLVSYILRRLNPNLSCCEKCGLPWHHCDPKSVLYDRRNGTFATCDVCWDNSTLDELKGYFTKVYKMQCEQWPITHTLEHLLLCVEHEYNSTNTTGVKT